jgi:hypothetical protein
MSSKQPRKRKPTASPGADLPQASALPDEPRGDEAPPALDRVLERGTATFADEFRRMRQDAAQRYTTQTLEPVKVEPPVGPTRPEAKAPLGNNQLGEPLAAPAAPLDAPATRQNEPQAAADAPPPRAKRGRSKASAVDVPTARQNEPQAAADAPPPRAKRGRNKASAVDAPARAKRAAPSATTPSAATAPLASGQLVEPPAARAAPPDAPATRQNEPQAAADAPPPTPPLVADTPPPTPPPIAEHSYINSGATDAPARAKRASGSEATPPTAQALWDNGQLDKQPAAPPDAPATRQKELRASIYIPPARPPVAKGGDTRSGMADAPAQVKAAPRSEATRPDPAHTITARSAKSLSLSSIRERFPWANDAKGVFALTIIFLLGLLLGFLLLEGKGQAFHANTPASRPVASDTDTRPNVAPTSQPVIVQPASAPASRPVASDTNAKPDVAPTSQLATAEPSIQKRPADAAVSTSVSTRPTIVPTPSRPEPTAMPSAAELVQRVTTAEQTLRAGAIEATLDYNNGSSASAQLRFDIGSTDQKSRFWIRSTYNGTSGSQVVERIAIGDKGWERQPDGHWLAGQPQGAIADQLRVFLPQFDQITYAEQSGDSDATTLHWYDASRNADVTLTIDQVTGIPRELRQIAREGGVKLVVVYTQWNTPMDITAPPEG